MTHPTDDSLKPCPFCGAGTTEITPKGRMWTGMKYSEPSSVSVRHWCEAVPGQPSRMIERVGRDEASAIDAWNARALLAAQPAVQQPAEDAELLAETPTPKPQVGLWTLIAPNGRMYQADSPLRCCGLEQRERVPADVAMARILRAASEPDDSELLDWLYAMCSEDGRRKLLAQHGLALAA